MKYLAIDPSWAKHTGIATCIDGYVNFDTMTSQQLWVYAERVKWLSEADVLIIEKQRGWNNFETTRKLVEAMCLWTIPARDMFKLPVIEIDPSMWQRAVSGDRRVMKKGDKKDQAAIEFYVRQRWTIAEDVPIPADAMSALGLLAYGMDQIKLAELQKQVGG